MPKSPLFTRKQAQVPPTNQETSDIVEGSKDVYEIAEAHAKVDDNTGIVRPKTVMLDKVAFGGLKVAESEDEGEEIDIPALLASGDIEECPGCGAYSAYSYDNVNYAPRAGIEGEDIPEDERVYHIGAASGFEWECGKCDRPWMEEDGPLDQEVYTHREASKTATEMTTTKALKLAEDVQEDLQALYLKAKPLTQVNESRPVREGVEAIYVAMGKLTEAIKLLSKQKRKEEEEEETVEAQEKRKKSSLGGLKVAAPEGDDFFKAYVEAALWSTNDESTDSGGEPLDKNYGPEDIAPETLARMQKDCTEFQEDNAQLLSAYYGDFHRGEWTAEEQGGHDFWLSRNGHGVGFFDRDFAEKDVRDALQEAAQAWGEFYLYVGDDGMIYGDGGSRPAPKTPTAPKISSKFGGLNVVAAEDEEEEDGGPAGSSGKHQGSKQAGKDACGNCGHCFASHNQPPDFSCKECKECVGWSDYGEKSPTMGKKAHGSSRKDRVQFSHLLKEHSPNCQSGVINKHVADTVAEELMRLGHAYKKIQGLWIGETMDPESQAKFQQQEHEIEDKIQGFASQLGVTAMFDGDPVKATIKLLFPDGFANDTENQGICVPTS